MSGDAMTETLELLRWAVIGFVALALTVPGMRRRR